MQGRLIIFCGIPGSGKTSVARLVAKTEPKTLHVQTDAVRAMITKPSYTSEESELVYRACVAVAKEALEEGYNVILDATFGSARRRANTLAPLAGHYSRMDYVHVVCDLETALLRNAARASNAVVPEETVRSIFSTFEPPTPALTIDTSRITPEDAAGLVVRALF
jgi:predicted kinase